MNQNYKIEFELPRRSDMHWRRKIWHMTAVFGLFLIQYSLPHDMTMALFVLAWLTFVPFDFLRLRNEQLNRFLLNLFRPIVRKNEIHRLAGTTYLLTGVILIHSIFDHYVVSLSLLFLAFADPIASYFGIRFGRTKIFKDKSLQGTLAAYFVCVICALIFYQRPDQNWMLLVVFSLLAGVVGSISELMTIQELDDNLSLPVLSAAGIWLLLKAFGIFGYALDLGQVASGGL